MTTFCDVLQKRTAIDIRTRTEAGRCTSVHSRDSRSIGSNGRIS